MAGRGRKSYTLEEKLQINIENTEKAKDYLKRLEKEKKELEFQIREERFNRIDELMKQSGKTYDDVLSFLVGQSC